MSATTYEHTTSTGRAAGTHTIASDIGKAILHWLGRIGERSPQGRAAAQFQRLNALSDAELARMGLKRGELLDRCFGWRAHW